MKKIAIIGSGSWGVALGIHLIRKGHLVKLWSFNKKEADSINNDKKCVFLPEVKLPEELRCTTDYEEAIDGSEIILLVTPSKVVRQNIQNLKQYVTDQEIIMCSKGLEDDTLLTLTQVLEEEMPNSKIGVFSGPSHAEEVALEIPTAMVIASKHETILHNIQDSFMTENFRIYTSKDVLGVEIGGALKNIIAFCAGIAAGLEYGDNTYAALITRGLAEISRLGTKMGAEQYTIYGLTGLGDLIVTCLSEHSRNRRAGKLIGQGKTMEETKKEVGMTIESIDNIQIVYKLAKRYEVEMPIVNAIYDLLFNSLNPRDAVNMLMTRAKKEE